MQTHGLIEMLYYLMGGIPVDPLPERQESLNLPVHVQSEDVKDYYLKKAQEKRERKAQKRRITV